MMRKCVMCGKEFRRHLHKIVCSPECKMARKLELERARRAKKRAEKVFAPIKCKWCGKVFVPTHGNARYCSPECKMEAYHPAGASEYIKRVRRPRALEHERKWSAAEYPESSAACMRGLSRSTMQSISDAVFGSILKGGVR